MAELRESIVDPKVLVDKLDPKVLVDKLDPKVPVDKLDSDTSLTSNSNIERIPLVRFTDDETISEPESVADNQIDEFYLSLSDMMDAIYTNHMLLTKSVNDVSHSIAVLKLDTVGMCDTYLEDISTVRKDIASIKRMIQENRNLFLTTLEKNTKIINARLDKLENH